MTRDLVNFSHFLSLLEILTTISQPMNVWGGAEVSATIYGRLKCKWTSKRPFRLGLSNISSHLESSSKFYICSIDKKIKYGSFHKITSYRVAMNRKRLDYRFRIYLCVHCILNDRAEIGQHTNGTAQGNPWGRTTTMNRKWRHRSTRPSASQTAISPPQRHPPYTIPMTTDCDHRDRSNLL